MILFLSQANYQCSWKEIDLLQEATGVDSHLIAHQNLIIQSNGLIFNLEYTFLFHFIVKVQQL
jgi:hypothetical protein